MKSFTTLRSKVLHLAAAAVLVFATVGMASAATIEFDQQGLSGGTLSYAGGIGSTLVGTNIDFGSVSVSGTSKDGIYQCQGCVLNFETSGSTAELGAAGPVPAIVAFAAGGTFVLTGTILDAALNPINTASNILLTGTFTGTPLLQDVGNNVQFSSGGVDTKNEEFLAFLGIGLNAFTFANSEISGASDFGTGFSLNNVPVEDADLTNTTVPEPSTMLLSGIALLALGGMARRRAKKA